MNKGRRYSPEFRERAVRLLFEHEKEYESRWAATVSIASKNGCTPETLRSWVKRFGVDTGRRDGLTAEGRARLKALEKENKELRWANEILKTASAFFALAETAVGLFKTEVIRQRGPWKNVKDVEYATLAWVDWFNHRRLLEPIGDMVQIQRDPNMMRSTGSRVSRRCAWRVRPPSRGRYDKSGDFSHQRVWKASAKNR